MIFAVHTISSSTYFWSVDTSWNCVASSSCRWPMTSEEKGSSFISPRSSQLALNISTVEPGCSQLQTQMNGFVLGRLKRRLRQMHCRARYQGISELHVVLELYIFCSALNRIVPNSCSWITQCSSAMLESTWRYLTEISASGQSYSQRSVAQWVALHEKECICTLLLKVWNYW